MTQLPGYRWNGPDFERRCQIAWYQELPPDSGEAWRRGAAPLWLSCVGAGSCFVAHEGGYVEREGDRALKLPLTVVNLRTGLAQKWRLVVTQAAPIGSGPVGHAIAGLEVSGTTLRVALRRGEGGVTRVLDFDLEAARTGR